MSRKLRLSLLAGCVAVGALHLPAATRVLGEGLSYRAREVRAMERVGGAEQALHVPQHELVAGGRP